MSDDNDLLHIYSRLSSVELRKQREFAEGNSVAVSIIDQLLEEREEKLAELKEKDEVHNVEVNSNHGDVSKQIDNTKRIAKVVMGVVIVVFIINFIAKYEQDAISTSSSNLETTKIYPSHKSTVKHPMSNVTYDELNNEVGCLSKYSEEKKENTFRSRYYKYWVTWTGEIAALPSDRVSLDIDGGLQDVTVTFSDPKAGYDLVKGEEASVTFLLTSLGGCFLPFGGEQAYLSTIEPTTNDVSSLPIETMMVSSKVPSPIKQNYPESGVLFDEIDHEVGCRSQYSEEEKKDVFSRQYKDRWMTWSGKVAALSQDVAGIDIDGRLSDLSVELTHEVGGNFMKGDDVIVRFLMKDLGGFFLLFKGTNATMRINPAM